MSERYHLRPKGRQGDVNWLQELETWSQRSQNRYRWQNAQGGGGGGGGGMWEARFIRIVSRGVDKKSAQQDAAIQLEDSPIPVLTIRRR
ncbi:hypothetical protein BDV93DRAFT_560142 [Ceratobasidium sp. AG-I]|nr:hypothetical protein BDV93DRAFT_560142 [Ceratobasidium sp. AG-I]